MPIFLSDTFSQSASSSLGVVNRHLMLSCAQQRQRLIDDVTLVGLHLIHLPVLDQLDHPARIEIDHEADAAAMLRPDARPPAAAGAGRSARPSASRPLGNASSGSVSLKFE